MYHTHITHISQMYQMQDICYSENHIVRIFHTGPDKSKIWFDLLWLDQIYFKLHILRQEIFVSCHSLWCWQYQRQMGKRLEGPSEFNFMSRNWSLNTVQKQPNSSAINSNLLLNIFPHWETSSKTEWGSLHSTISITN